MNADKGISIIRRTFSESSLKEALTRDIASQPRNTTEDNRVSLKMGHREFLWVEGELLINWKPWKWWQKQQLTFWRRQLTLRVKSLFVENFEFKILVWDSEGGIPRNLSSVKSQSGITGRFAPFYSVWNLTAARTRCTICFRA